MTAFRSLVFGVLVWTLLGASASAAPMSSSTPGAWAWWSASYPSPGDTSSDANQLANSLDAAQTITASSSTSLLSNATSSSAPAPSSTTADAFINLGNGPYPLASQITTGNAQPWSIAPRQLVSSAEPPRHSRSQASITRFCSGSSRPSSRVA